MTRTLLAAALLASPALAADPGETCFHRLAATRSFTLGAPNHALPLPDGRTVLFLRSQARETKLGLFAYDIATHAERELLAPESSEKLSVEEKARRERARMTLTGITGFSVSRDGGTVLVEQAGKLQAVAMPGGAAHPLPGEGWIAPRLSPDGKFVAAVRDDDLHVIDVASGQDRAITHGGSETLTRGLPEFAAAEEFARPDGAWWSPDGATLLYEEADSSGVEKHFISDPEHPSSAPVEFRYPRAGTANARVRLGLVSRDGGPTRWLRWDAESFPYLVRVVWPAHGKLSLVVLNRAQTEERVLAADPATGETSTLLAEHDPAWVEIGPEVDADTSGQRALPAWLPDGSGFLWAAERDGIWALELHKPDGSLERRITDADHPFVSLEDIRPDGLVITYTAANPDRLQRGVFWAELRGGEQEGATAIEPGLHHPRFAENGHRVFLDTYLPESGQPETQILQASGDPLGVLRSVAEAPPSRPSIAWTEAGARKFSALVLHPHDFVPGRKYPVVLSVYAGPTVQVVQRADSLYFEDQCLADQGFVVVSLDGRGTPGRDSAWLRAVKGNLIDVALNDQVDGLRALGAAHPEMDLSRVGVTGWSFGGYFSAMATIRRPDVFASGVAGAPVVDWQQYDTAYTERYLGLPAEDAKGYAVSNVLTYAKDLSRPLLLMHGLTDDNVYFANSFLLTQALFTAGKPYRLVLLPGTHLLPDPTLRARVDEVRASFLKESLGVK